MESAQNHYKNHHVYPYTYLGGYHYRQKQYKEAFAAWANAGDVIRLFIYSRDDEEIYKEFLDIANELIPHIMKMESSGHSAKSILRDPYCFAHLLRLDCIYYTIFHLFSVNFFFWISYKFTKKKQIKFHGFFFSSDFTTAFVIGSKEV